MSIEDFEAVLDCLGDPVFIKDEQYRYILVNDAFCKDLGVSREQSLGQTDYTIFAKELADVFRVRDAHVFATGEGGFHEDQITGPNGKVRTVAAKMTLYTDGAARKYIVGVVRDITQFRRTEEALRESEVKYRTIVENSLMGVYVYQDNRFQFHNRRCNEIIGYGDEEMAVANPLDFAHPDERAAVQDTARRLLTGELTDVRLTGRAIRKNGETIVVRVFGNVANYEGRPAIMGTIYDITEQEKAQEQIRKSEEKFKKAFYTSPDAININRLSDGMFISTNRGFTELTGYTEEDVAGKTSLEIDIWSDAGDRAKLLEGLKTQGRVENLEAPFRLKNGEIRSGMMSATLIDLDGSPHILSITRDITEHKRAEEEREKLQRQLNQAQKMESVGRLAGGVAHDFNNMLTVILGYAEMALLQCTSSEPIYENLKTIKAAALQSADLVRQLLAFARKQTIVPKVLDVNDTVAGMLKMLQRLIGEEIDFGWMPGPALWSLKMDPSQFDQLLANLCVNARDAITGVGKITIETENRVFDQAYCQVHPGFVPGEYVMVAVSDNGCGMEKEVMGQIFEPFFTTKETGKGTGLGLATVYGIIKQNDGFINVYSEPAKGSTFKIYLPRFVGVGTERKTAVAQEIPRGKREIVLVVEDDIVILTLGKAMLEALGYTVLTASTPAEALRQAATHRNEIELLITDVVMPEMNGRDLAKLLCEMIPGLKCLYTSGYTPNAIAHHGVLDEGVNFLEKPFSIDGLAAKVREALEQE
jgi:two-component system, cell cycle sensor histidine kinase and response regulator CckA